MNKDSTTVTTTSIKITTTKFFGQCWNQDYICGCTDCAKLENKGEELVQCKIQKLWKFCSEVCKRIGDCKTWNKGRKFPFCKIYILHSLPFHRSVLHNLSAFHLFSFAKISSSLNWLGCFGTVSESTFCNKLHLFDENCTPALKTQLLFQKLFKFCINLKHCQSTIL